MSEASTVILGQETRVTELLEQEVAERGLGPGDKLPTEREFAQRSKQSRATVRRALEALDAQGRIVRHIGRGTFLAPARPDELQELPTDESISPAQIMAVRLLIEPQMMPLIVAAATPADFAEMTRCLRGGDEAQDHHEFELWDFALHQTLAQATHNLLLTRICQMANSARHQPLWGKLKLRSSTPERINEYKQDHHQIVDALSERDADAAYAAMRAHLLRVRTYILGEPV